MRNTIRLGKLFDIDIGLDFSWLLIFALVTWSLAQHYLTAYQDWSFVLRWGLAITTSLFFFASVLAHELAHSLVSKHLGIPVPRITLYLFGGASQISEEPRRAQDEFWMALAGPMTSLVLAAGFGVVWLATGPNGTANAPRDVLNAFSGWLGGINLMLGLFNLLPGFPLDGGRVLRSIVWAVTNSVRRATAVAVGAGVLVSWAMIGIGLWLVLDGDWVDGLWLAFLGWFLQGAAQQEGRGAVVHDVLQGHTVREVPLGGCQRVMKQLSLDVFIEYVAIPSGQRCFAVTEGDQLLGMVTLHQLQKVPRDQWKTTRVGQVMIPPDKLVTVRLDEDLTRVLEKMGTGDVNQMPVFDGDRFVGMITRGSIIAFLRLHGQQRGQAA